MNRITALIKRDMRGLASSLYFPWYEDTQEGAMCKVGSGLPPTPDILAQDPEPWETDACCRAPQFMVFLLQQPELTETGTQPSVSTTNVLQGETYPWAAHWNRGAYIPVHSETERCQSHFRVWDFYPMLFHCKTWQTGKHGRASQARTGVLSWNRIPISGFYPSPNQCPTHAELFSNTSVNWA